MPSEYWQRLKQAAVMNIMLSNTIGKRGIQKIKEPFMVPLKFILTEILRRKERIMNREILFCLFMSRWLS